MNNLSVFLFPHQDDEFAAFHIIHQLVEKQHPLKIIYLTDGAYGKATVEIRHLESLAVLKKLGVKEDQIWFLGEEMNVPNLGMLPYLDTLLSAIVEKLLGQRLASLYTPAFEGGHPDHDGAAILALRLQMELGSDDGVYQFPMYNSYKCTVLPYAVLRPITEAGNVSSVRVPVAMMIKYIGLCARYRSQAKTFIGLMPFVLLHYFTSATQQFQKLTSPTVFRKPHDGIVLYERRGWLTWVQFNAEVDRFRAPLVDVC